MKSDNTFTTETHGKIYDKAIKKCNSTFHKIPFFFTDTKSILNDDAIGLFTHAYTCAKLEDNYDMMNKCFHNLTKLLNESKMFDSCHIIYLDIAQQYFTKYTKYGEAETLFKEAYLFALNKCKPRNITKSLEKIIEFYKFMDNKDREILYLKKLIDLNEVDYKTYCTSRLLERLSELYIYVDNLSCAIQIYEKIISNISVGMAKYSNEKYIFKELLCNLLMNYNTNIQNVNDFEEIIENKYRLYLNRRYDTYCIIKNNVVNNDINSYELSIYSVLYDEIDLYLISKIKKDLIDDIELSGQDDLSDLCGNSQVSNQFHTDLSEACVHNLIKNTNAKITITNNNYIDIL